MPIPDDLLVVAQTGKWKGGERVLDSVVRKQAFSDVFLFSQCTSTDFGGGFGKTSNSHSFFVECSHIGGLLALLG